MSTRDSVAASKRTTEPKDVRHVTLDAVDAVLVAELERDARMPNNALAAAAGIAPSTCLGRVRSLVERGVIRGFHADIDPAAIGRSLQAMISVRLQPNARRHIHKLADQLTEPDAVLDVYFIAGADDFLIHVATPDTETLRTSSSTTCRAILRSRARRRS